MATNFSSGFMDDLGSLGALWAGRNQGLDENSTLLNQQATLEQIANAQQNRDIQQQKLPFELAQLKHQQEMNPLLLQEKQVKIKADNQKLNKDDFDNFWGEFRRVAPTLSGTPADGAVLAELAKKNNLDPADQRIARIIHVGTSGNLKAMQEMIKKIDEMSPKVGEKTAETKAEAAIKADPKNIDAGVKYRVDAEERWRAQDRTIKLQIAQAKATAAEHSKKNRNFEQAATEYYDAAQNAYAGGLQAQGERLMQQAMEMRDLALRAKAEGRNTPQAGETTVGVDPATGKRVLTTREAQPTPPMTNSQGGEKPKFDPAKLQGQDKSAYDWAMKNRADPRATEILKRLGAQ